MVRDQHGFGKLQTLLTLNQMFPDVDMIQWVYLLKDSHERDFSQDLGFAIADNDPVAEGRKGAIER